MAMNYLAVLASAIASFVIGMIWYGPLFGKRWMKLSGVTPQKMKGKSPVQSMLMGFVASLVTAYVLATFVGYMMSDTFMLGAQLAFWLWLGLVAPVQLGSFLWEGKPFSLFVLNTAYNLVTLIVMTGILAVWH